MPPGSRSAWTEADLDPSVKKTCEKKSMKKKIQEFIKIFKYHFERFIRKNVYMEFFFFNITPWIRIRMNVFGIRDQDKNLCGSKTLKISVPYCKTNLLVSSELSSVAASSSSFSQSSSDSCLRFRAAPPSNKQPYV